MSKQDEFVDIVFDGPLGNISGRFIEVEKSSGASIRLGGWMQREDGYWVLRIPDPRAEIERLRAENARLREIAECNDPGAVKEAGDE